MKHYRSGFVAIIVLSLLPISFFALIGCTNEENTIDIMDYEEVSVSPPIEITLEQLREEYFKDPIAADDKYKGRRLCFYEVEAQEIVSHLQYFIADDIKFVLASDSQMQNVELGSVMNLVGECRGLEYNPEEAVAIRDCWAEGVNCDLGGYVIADTY